MGITSHKELVVWQHGIQLVKAVYRVARKLPKFELFGLTSQLQRAAVSIPANIAEGYGRQHKGEYVRHLTIANGSLKELETLIEIALQLSYIEAQDHATLIQMTEVEGRMLNGLIRSLRQTLNSPST